MPGLQDLINMTQGGGGAPPASGPIPGQQNMGAYLNANATPAPGVVTPDPADPVAQLTQLLGKVASSPQGGAMMQALTQTMAGAGGNGGGDGQLDRMAMAPAGSPRMPQMPNGGTPENRGAVGTGPGPMTDQGLTDMLNASDSVRSDLPPAKRDGYTGADSQEGIPGTDDPKLDDIGRDVYPWRQGQLQNDSYNGPGGSQKPGNQDTVRDQLNKQQGMSTEDELDMVHKNLGKTGDPSEDGNFPTAAEIKALTSGQLDPKQFDAKWGKGAAKEMMDNADQENDDGDHEYR